MQTWLLWMLLVGPAALVAAALLPAGADVRAHRAYLAAVAALATAVVGAGVLALAGPLETGTAGWNGVGFAVSLDALSGVVLLLVAFVGAVVTSYSRNYLKGDAAHGRFTTWLALTLAAVLVLIVSGNLFQLLLAWIATSVALNRLLLFYPGRANAVLAARKKLVSSRIGDACLIGAALLLFSAFGSLDHGAIRAGTAALAAGGEIPGGLHGAALLIVVAALLKSAQFPFHGWLTEVMETPTPVSALLHAGIINAGGYLLLRYADVIVLSAPSLHVLVAVGGLTALVGSVVMLTQTSIKVQLAWSTIAQMGFMMLQIGLGAFSAALLHLVAHSLYKAHAFLSSGSVIDLARASWTPSPGGNPHPGRLGLAILLLLGATLTVGALFGATLISQPGVLALGAILVLGLTHLVVSAVDERPTAAVIGRTLGMAAAVSVGYFALQAGAAVIAAGAVPPVRPLAGWFDLAVIGLVVAGFAAITVLQSMMAAHASEPRWQALYAHASNGFYVNTLANRLAVRLWPASATMPLGHLANRKGH